MKAKPNQKSLKLVAVISMAMFSLFATICATLSWFISVRNVESEGNNFPIEKVGTAVKNIEFHNSLGEIIEVTVGNNAPVSLFATKKTYAKMSADASQYQNNDYIEVTKDENNGGRTTIYQFTSPSTFTLYHDSGSATTRVDKKYFAFDPSVAGSITFNDGVPSFDGTVAMGKYSLDNPNHPILILFKVDGYRENISIETENPFLAEDPLASVTTTVNTYAEMTSGAHNVNDTISVKADSTHTNAHTVYKYLGDDEYELIWLGLCESSTQSVIDAARYPLSSVTQFHTFKLNLDDGEHPLSGDYLSNHDVRSISDLGVTTTSRNVSCYPMDEADFTSDKKHSFTNFTSETSKAYTKNVTLFDDYVDDCNYVGVVLNYESLALEYLFTQYLGHEALSSNLKFDIDWVTKV